MNSTIKITLFNEYLRKNVDLSLLSFKTKDGNILFAADHESFENLAREELNDVSIETRVCAASERYAAVQVTVSDEYGRYVSEVGDINTYHLDEKNFEYKRRHPLVAAKIDAFDAAIRKFLNIPRSFNPKEYPELLSEIERIKAEEAINELLENQKNQEDTEKENAEYYENSEADDKNLLQDYKKGYENDCEKQCEENSDSVLISNNPYADCLFPGGKYTGMPCREVWVLDQGYFNRTKAWKGYEDMAKFAKYMEEHKS